MAGHCMPSRGWDVPPAHIHYMHKHTHTQHTLTQALIGIYISDLLLLHAAQASNIPMPTPSKLLPVVSPLKREWGTWRARLMNHPDQQFAEYVLTGIKEGFQIGFKQDITLVVTPQPPTNTPRW